MAAAAVLVADAPECREDGEADAQLEAEAPAETNQASLEGVMKTTVEATRVVRRAMAAREGP